MKALIQKRKYRNARTRTRTQRLPTTKAFERAWTLETQTHSLLVRRTDERAVLARTHPVE